MMMASSKGWVEKMRRIARTIYFMVAMVASLLVMSLPLLIAIGDVLLPALLISSFTCVTCHSFLHHLRRYAFNSSLTDIPLVSLIRSLLITCKPLSLSLSLSLSLPLSFCILCTM